jgi:hypothetical protein
MSCTEDFLVILSVSSENLSVRMKKKSGGLPYSFYIAPLAFYSPRSQAFHYFYLLKTPSL